MYHHYPFVAADINAAAALSNSSYWRIANRISYVFNFQGPSLAVDTACSSSLTAIHLACESINSGACQMAVARRCESELASLEMADPKPDAAIGQRRQK